MTLETKRPLKKLNNKNFAEHIKLYLKSSYQFYGTLVPEINVLAKKLHEEHNLKQFYKIFNKLWESGSYEETSLALYTLELYEKDFDFSTWKFIKPKLKNIKSRDQIEAIATKVIGKIIQKYPRLEKEIIKLNKRKDLVMKQLTLMSSIPKIKDNDLRLGMTLIKNNLYDEDTKVQEIVGELLNEASKVNKERVKKFILKNKNMPEKTFLKATENMKDLRQIRRKKMKAKKKR